MKTMTAKFPGVCKRTGQRINVGDTINYFGRGHAELVGTSEDVEYLENVSNDELASDRRMAKQGISVIRFSSGHVMTQNSRGRCEDAPCCGCCS